MLEEEVFLITGGGSLGRALVKRLLELNPRAIRVLDSSEHALFRVQHEFPNTGKIRYLLGDISDYDRVEFAMEDANYVIHTAANKFIDFIEYNPFQALKTNIDGTINVIKAAMKIKSVKKVIYTSSDKAVDPTSTYGHSKALGEHLFLWANRVSDKIFTTVRLPNFRSRGSVFDIWEKQRHEGRPLSITDPRMERIFIGVEDAVKIVLKVLETAKGGEIFVPAANIQTKKIVDLAKQISDNIEVIGIRPGEKLRERLISEEEQRRAVRINDFWVIK